MKVKARILVPSSKIRKNAQHVLCIGSSKNRRQFFAQINAKLK